MENQAGQFEMNLLLVADFARIEHYGEEVEMLIAIIVRDYMNVFEPLRNQTNSTNPPATLKPNHRLYPWSSNQGRPSIRLVETPPCQEVKHLYQ